MIADGCQSQLETPKEIENRASSFDRMGFV